MCDENIYSPKALRELLSRYGKPIKRSLGQNYLINRGALKTIAACAEESFQSQTGRLIEIGPGLGHLTAPLLASGRNVTSVEIDKLSCQILSDRFNGTKSGSRFRLIQGDYLALLKNSSLFADTDKEIGVVGNLPYYITSEILLETLFHAPPSLSFLLVMMQEETANRLLAQPGNRLYGITSVFCHYFARLKQIMVLKPGSFYPAPKVSSSLIKLQLKKERPAAASLSLFRWLVRASFAKRRKKIRTSLSHAFKSPGLPAPVSPDEMGALWRQEGDFAEKRPEELSWEEYLKLSNALEQIRKDNGDLRQKKN